MVGLAHLDAFNHLQSSSVITGENNSEEMTPEQVRQLEDVNRLKAEFLANCSHELRTPIHAIVGYAELLLDNVYGSMTDEQEQTVGYIRESAQDLLHDLVRANERRVTIDEIQKRVAEHFNIKMAEMTSSRRARVVARPRQVAMYLAKQLTSRSLPEIGRKFGGRDHTTVMHAVKKIEELVVADRALAEDVEVLRRMLQS